MVAIQVAATSTHAVALDGVIANPLAAATVAGAAAPEKIHVDLHAAREAASKTPLQYAVDLPHEASIATAGLWSYAGDRATWTYSVSVPGAANVAFHAAGVNLPIGATLTQSDAYGHALSYTTGQMNGSEIWSRMSQGDLMVVKIEVPASAQSVTTLHLVSIQAGFTNPGQSAVRPTQTSGAAAYPCEENYECYVNGANSRNSRSSVGISITNTTFCSATLVNDGNSDFKMYFITAAHCGKPTDAPSINIYWQARTPCGTAPTNVYSTAMSTQSGAVSRMQYQDTWLIEANRAAVAGAMPYWAGIDATDSAVNAGTLYGIHYAQVLAAQYVESTQGLSRGFDGLSGGPTWVMTNTTGSVDHGASGSALFDPNGRAIGDLSAATTACPGTSSAQQSISYQRLGPAWAGDGTTTGSLQPWLLNNVLNGMEDPNRVGTPVVTFTASPTTVVQQSQSTLTWSASHADNCALSPNPYPYQPTNPTTSSATVKPNFTTTYTLTCTSSDGHATQANVTVTVTIPQNNGSGGGGGGSGALDLLTLLALGASARVRRAAAILSGRTMFKRKPRLQVWRSRT